MSPARKPPSGGVPLSPEVPVTSPAELGPRKLIRPALSEVRREMGGPRTTLSRKSTPPEQTNAEAFYYIKQMQSRTPLVVVLLDGEEIRGWIEWYDRDVLKVNREGAPNLLVSKRAIKYILKQDEERQYRRRRPRGSGAEPPEGVETREP